MRSGFEETNARFEAVDQEMRPGFADLGERVGRVETTSVRHQAELLAAVAKGHGLESRVSKLESTASAMKRKR